MIAPAIEPMARSMSLAVVGAGSVAMTYHVPCVTAAGATIEYVVDPDPSTRRRVPALIRGAIALRDLADLPRGVEGAIVCSPPAFHAAHARWLVERGIHVLCEKPLACTRDDAEVLVDVARANGVVLQVGYYRRFHPSAQRVRAMLRDGGLGGPVDCTSVGGHVLGPHALRGFLADPRQSGGGVLMDVGVHIIDRLLSWFDAVTVAEYLDDHEGGMEANALVRLEGRLNDRVVPVTVLLSRTSDFGYRTAIRFDGATVTCDLNAGHELEVLAPAPAGFGEECRPRATLRCGEARTAADYFRDQWAEFVGQVGGAPGRVSSLRDAARATAIVEECYRARRRLRLTWEACALT